MKSLVLYYSKSGNTRKVADKIIERFSSDELFIQPSEKYGSYIPSLIKFGKDKKNGHEVGCETEIADLSKYDVIFVGFPVWGGVMPQFMQKYILGCNFQGKKVIPFATAGSNGKKSALNKACELIPNCDRELYFYTNMFARSNVDKWLDDVAGKLAM